ncbi:MAG: NAD(P)-dependent oxidoreductase [Myxococcales bacterium]|nr:NAD(P)-dependent oxidoreductase [Polyangiaceae bacterium]MDW8249427.1 NAD(P)-dependent oxidoreductase [Myxococcales bacterium]
MARVLVTGSQGFVGKHLRAALVARRCEVIGVDRPGTGAEIEIDLSAPDLDTDALAAAVGSVDALISMAATITRGSSVDAFARRNLRVIAEVPVRLWESLSARGSIPHHVYCSTYKTYGPPASLPIDPELPPQRPDPHSYGSAKSLAERLLALSSARLGGAYAIVRPTCIYGPGQHLHNAIPLFLKAGLAGKNPVVHGDGKSLRDDVLAYDLSFCLAEAALRRVRGAFHAAGECARTILETAQVCCEVVSELLGGKPLAPELDPTHPPKWWLDQSFDLTRSRELLGYEPTPLREGISWEARWLQAGADPADTVRFCPAPRVLTSA